MSLICCEHYPCLGRPKWLLGRFQTRPWRCPECGQLWITEPRYLWGDFDGYTWKKVEG